MNKFEALVHLVGFTIEIYQDTGAAQKRTGGFSQGH
jgi:hypothetical protein